MISKIILALMLIMIMVTMPSCDEEECNEELGAPEWITEPENCNAVEFLDIMWNSYGIGVLEYENCEYLVLSAGKRGGIAHKGNCRNPEHQNHAEKEISLPPLEITP